MSLVGVDIDDVLSLHAEGFVKFSNDKWGTNLRVEDYTEHYAEMWQVDHEEVLDRVKHFYKVGGFADYKPIERADESLRRIAKHHDLIIVTSRRRLSDSLTAEWINRHYGGLFKEIHFADLYESDNPEDLHKTKADLAVELGLEWLVDDQPKHCFAAAAAGIQAILYGDYPWNQVNKLPAGVSRALTWPQVEEVLVGRAAR